MALMSSGRYFLLIVLIVLSSHFLLSLTHDAYARATSWSRPRQPTPIPQEYYTYNQTFDVKFRAKANATFIILARNSDMDNTVRSMRRMEDRFNTRHHYPYVLLNDEPFAVQAPQRRINRKIDPENASEHAYIYSEVKAYQRRNFAKSPQEFGTRSAWRTGAAQRKKNPIIVGMRACTALITSRWSAESRARVQGRCGPPKTSRGRAAAGAGKNRLKKSEGGAARTSRKRAETRTRLKGGEEKRAARRAAGALSTLHRSLGTQTQVYGAACRRGIETQRSRWWGGGKSNKKEQGGAVSGAAHRQGIATLRSREKSKKKTGAVATSRGSAGTRTRLSGAQRRRDIATLGSWLRDGEKSNKNKGGDAKEPGVGSRKIE
ncbi:glycolipid 2-alpha-mannosyltransferase-domain-containing protein [Mycena rebaudengoi]|nr:glycolipid 2-alpha-mannosyltransferase-domain-containing protein [Mycena rebaudengoi]